MLLLLLLLLILPVQVSAGPSSTNYELQDYSFGSGGTDTTFSSTNYKLFGISGQTESSSLQSLNFGSENGLVYLLQTGIPSAPTLSNNDSHYYDKLHLTINFSSSYGSIPNDILFAIAVSTDNFVSDTKYVQADQTLGVNPAWQSYTTWGGTSGFNILSLSKDTIYYAKVTAKQGNFTQSAYGPTATLPTAENDTISFNLITSSLDLGTLTPGNVVASPSEGQINLTTNSNSGALIYIYSTNSGLKSASQGNYTISTVSGSQNLTGLSQGYGLRGTTVTQTSGLMAIEQPYNGSGSIVGQLDTQRRILFSTNDAPIVDGIGKFEIRAKSSLTTPPASDYADIITVIAAGTF